MLLASGAMGWFETRKVIRKSVVKHLGSTLLVPEDKDENPVVPGPAADDDEDALLTAPSRATTPARRDGHASP